MRFAALMQFKQKPLAPPGNIIRKKQNHKASPVSGAPIAQHTDCARWFHPKYILGCFSCQASASHFFSRCEELLFSSPTGVEHSPHLSGTVGLLLICRPQLASASLRPPHQNQLRYYSLKCARQFLRSGFLPGRGIERSEAFPALQGQ